jgi:dihydroxyacetone kinase
MDRKRLAEVFSAISKTMDENREYLIELDQQNGDGDLGISMSSGFRAVRLYLEQAEETDLGKLFMKGAAVFNEAAPSSLGTILSLGMMGMARRLKGMESADFSEMNAALDQGLRLLMEKAGSRPGEKTILDALCPAVQTLLENEDKPAAQAYGLAAAAAAEGSEATRQMKPVHGRAVYYGEKGIGLLDGGSVAGKLMIEAIARHLGGIG